jgi:hypothetical protein
LNGPPNVQDLTALDRLANQEKSAPELNALPVVASGRPKPAGNEARPAFVGKIRAVPGKPGVALVWIASDFQPPNQR